jgi:hypothetical protein
LKKADNKHVCYFSDAKLQFLFKIADIVCMSKNYVYLCTTNYKQTHSIYIAGWSRGSSSGS